jgi:predicted CXXCH cytochrome family protein
MKRIIVVSVALAFVLLSAGAALAGIAGSKHDMRTHITGEAQGYDEVCVYCHTPHSGNLAAQLWNRTNPANGGYTPYTSSTMNATPSGTIGAGSLLCMSCHDGILAVDALYNLPNYGNAANNISGGVALDGAKKLQGAALMGTDLRNDHPIGFTYPALGVDSGLVNIATVATSTYVRLIGGTQVECASCHDAHNTVTMPFLRSTNQGSQLCLACHLK